MMAETTQSSEKSVCLSIPFSSIEGALLAHKVLTVDKELKGSKVRREIATDEANLIINLYGADLKTLRVAVNTVFNNILLIVKTIEQFENW